MNSVRCSVTEIKSFLQKNSDSENFGTGRFEGSLDSRVSCYDRYKIIKLSIDAANYALISGYYGVCLEILI